MYMFMKRSFLAFVLSEIGLELWDWCGYSRDLGSTPLPHVEAQYVFLR